MISHKFRSFFFYCVTVKLLSVVPAVTSMGGWSDVSDGVVHLHFYQKTVHLIFIHSHMCVISEFNR